MNGIRDTNNKGAGNEHELYRRYSMLIQWSEEDQVYVVSIPELPGAKTHGYTYEEAARQGQDLIESWVDANIAWGRPVPPPSLFKSQEPGNIEELEVKAS
ncbi:MAG: type II toxin-antitoxin system HicB family antitoxin [Chloroflexia bacterium]